VILANFNQMQRKKPMQRAFTGLAGSFLTVVKPEAPAPQPPAPPPELLKAKPGRPPKHDKTMSPAERKRQSRAKKINDAELKKLIAEQKIDDGTGGRGRGMFLSDVEKCRERGMNGAKAGRGRIITGWRGRDFENTVALASEGARLDLKQFGGKKTKRRDTSEGDTPGADNEGYANEGEDKFHHRAHPHNWTFDSRDKEEIARKRAAHHTEIFNPKHYLKWDVTMNEFIPWDASMCSVCRRVFAFPRQVEAHIVEMIGFRLLRRPEQLASRWAPATMQWVLTPAECAFNADVTRHRRIVLKGLKDIQPKQTKRPKVIAEKTFRDIDRLLVEQEELPLFQ
jgi:hypothetical protein